MAIEKGNQVKIKAFGSLNTIGGIILEEDEEEEEGQSAPLIIEK